jgi:hypothetical protein
MRYDHDVRFVMTFPVACLLLSGGCDGCGPPPGVDAGPRAERTVAINEVMTRNASTLRDADGQFDDWLELLNLTDAAVPLDGYTLQDSASEPAPIAAGAVLPPRGFLVLFADDTSPGSATEPHLPFKLSGDGETLLLANADGIVDDITVPALSQDESYGSLPDGDAARRRLPAPTPGRANDSETERPDAGPCVSPFDSAPSVVVNEVLVQNATVNVDEQGEREPWIELYNAGASAVTLTGLVLADNDALQAAFLLPAETLAPGAFLLIFADGERGEGERHTTDGFVLTTVDEVVALGDVCGSVFQVLPLAGGDVDVSVGLAPDGNLDGVGPRTPTPAAANR